MLYICGYHERLYDKHVYQVTFGSNDLITQMSYGLFQSVQVM